MRRKKRKTRLCVTPYSGWKMSSTDGGMVRSSYIIILQTLDKPTHTEIVFRLPEIAKSTMQGSNKDVKATIVNQLWNMIFFVLLQLN